MEIKDLNKLISDIWAEKNAQTEIAKTAITQYLKYLEKNRRHAKLRFALFLRSLLDQLPISSVYIALRELSNEYKISEISEEDLKKLKQNRI